MQVLFADLCSYKLFQSFHFRKKVSENKCNRYTSLPFLNDFRGYSYFVLQKIKIFSQLLLLETWSFIYFLFTSISISICLICIINTEIMGYTYAHHYLLTLPYCTYSLLEISWFNFSFYVMFLSKIWHVAVD